MEDKWKQKFRDKFDGFQPETVIPEFVPAATKRATPFWMPITAAAAAIATVVICIHTFLDRGSIVSPEGTHLIAEPVAVLQDRPVLPLAKPIYITNLREKAPSTPQTEPIISSPISQSEEVVEIVEEANNKENGSRRDSTQRNDAYTWIIHDGSPETVSSRSRRPVTLQFKGTPFFGMTTIDTKFWDVLAGPTGGADTTYTCHLPLKASISFCINLTPTLSLESGISYRYHAASWLFRIGDESVSQAFFRQHYIGIPIKINYQCLEQNRLKVYLSLGEETFLRIKGTEERYSYSKPLATNEMDGHPITCSLNMAAGLDYRLTPLISLYAEPGIAWHFIRTWDAPDYYQKHPLSFDLNVGLRLRLLD